MVPGIGIYLPCRFLLRIYPSACHLHFTYVTCLTQSFSCSVNMPQPPHRALFIFSMFQPLHIIINWPSFTTMKNCTSHCFVKYLSLIDKVLSLLEGHQLPQLHPHLLHSCDRVPSSAPPTSLTARQHSVAMHSSDSPINTFFHPGLHCLVPITHIANQISYNI